MAIKAYVDWSGLKYYDDLNKQYIDEKFGAGFNDCLKWGGAVAFKDLPSPDAEDLHVVFRITDNFTTIDNHNWFVSDDAFTYYAGTLLVCVKVGEGDQVDYLYDILYEAPYNIPLNPEGEADLANMFKRVEALEKADADITTRVDDVESSLDTQATEIGNLKTNLQAVEEAVAEIPDSIAEVGTALTAVSNKVNEHTTAIETITTEVGKKADVEDIPDISNLATKEEVNESIKTAIEAIPPVDFTGIATEEFVTKTVETAIDNIPETDLTGYATEQFVADKIAEIPPTDFTGYATEKFVTDAIAAIPETDLSNHVTKKELADTKLDFEADIVQLSEKTEASIQSLETELEANKAADITLGIKVDSLEVNVKSAEANSQAASAAVTEFRADVTRLSKDVTDIKVAQSLLQKDVDVLEGSLEKITTDLAGKATKDDIKTFVSSDEINLRIDNKTLVLADELEEATAAINELTSKKADKATTLSGYSISDAYTKTQVDENIAKAIAAAELSQGDVDLSAYYTKSETELAIRNSLPTKTSQLINDSGYLTAIPSEYVKTSDLNNYATKSETNLAVSALQAKVDAIKVPTKVSELTNDAKYVTETTLEGKHYLTAVPEEYAKTADVKTLISEIDFPETDLTNYYTKAEVENVVLEAQPTSVSELENDLGFITDAQVAAKYLQITDAPTKVSDLTNDSGYVTAKIVEGYYTSEETDEAIAAAIAQAKLEEGEVDLSAYYTKTETDKAIETAIAEIDIPEVDLEGYATEEFVKAEIAAIDQPDLSGYALKTELPVVPTKVTELENDAGYITAIPEEYITEATLATKNYLTAVPDEYVTNTELEEKGYLTAHQDISNLATKQEVADAVAGIVIPTKVSELENDAQYLVAKDVATFATKEEVEGVQDTLQSVSDVADTAKEIADNNTKDIADNTTAIETLTQQYNNFTASTEERFEDIGSDIETLTAGIGNAQGDIETLQTSKQDKLISGETIATVNGANLLAGGNVQIDSVTSPDDITFTFDGPTRYALGGIAVGTVITNWSLTKLIETALFGIAEERKTAVEKIMENELGVYTIDVDDELVPVEYDYQAVNEADVNVVPTISGFYQVVDGTGAVKESGYQLLTAINNEQVFQVALPTFVDLNTTGRVDEYDALQGKWQTVWNGPANEYSTFFTDDLTTLVDLYGQSYYESVVANVLPDGYKLWITPKQVACGKIYRIIIE